MYLILTLNQCYPDYDFSKLRAQHFRKDSQAEVEPAVDSHLFEVSKVRWHRLLQNRALVNFAPVSPNRSA